MATRLVLNARLAFEDVKAILKCPISGYLEMSQNYKNNTLEKKTNLTKKNLI